MGGPQGQQSTGTDPNLVQDNEFTLTKARGARVEGPGAAS